MGLADYVAILISYSKEFAVSCVFCCVYGCVVHALDQNLDFLGLSEVEEHAGCIATNTVHVVATVCVIRAALLKVGFSYVSIT